MQSSAFVLLTVLASFIRPEHHQFAIFCYHFHEGEIFPIFVSSSALQSFQKLLGYISFSIAEATSVFPSWSFAISFRWVMCCLHWIPISITFLSDSNISLLSFSSFKLLTQFFSTLEAGAFIQKCLRGKQIFSEWFVPSISKITVAIVWHILVHLMEGLVFLLPK